MKRDEQIQALSQKEYFNYEDLVDITALLRGEGGCPWDREQTHESVRRCMIEEAYEVAEAIDKKDSVLLCEELGDVLFQVLFHAELEREAKRFSMEDVIDGICRKMIRRHPHVFGTTIAQNEEEALSQWEAIKSREKQRKTTYDRLSSIPQILPALLRAQKVNEKMDDTSSKSDKLFEETLLEKAGEYAAFSSNETLGELLFLLTKDAAGKGLDAEFALTQTTNKRILSTK